MRNLFLLNILMFLVGSLGWSTDNTPNAPSKYKRFKEKLKFRHEPQKLIIKWKSQKNKHIYSGQYTRALDSKSKLELVEIGPSQDLLKTAEKYLSLDEVEYVEPDYIYSINSQPDDTDFGGQWGLHNTGQAGGTADADMNAPEAWDVTVGSEDVVIGVIDSGINYNHTDIVDNLWVNSGEIAGDQIDNDSNGYVDDVYGYNTNADTGDPLDDNGHGSHVAGIIGARGNNSFGVSGVMQQVKIASCKFLSAAGFGSTSAAIACLEYFLALKIAGVNIVVTNNSWGGGPSSQALYDAIKAHQDAEILFVTAAGNDANNNDLNPEYPSNFQLPNIISVASSDDNDAFSEFSNFGRSVHIAAPGEDIYSLNDESNGFENQSGTSMAAPQVAGAIGLLKASDSDLDWKAMKNLILAGGQDISAFENLTLTGKRLRLWDADGVGSLTCSNQALQKRLLPLVDGIGVRKNDAVKLSALSINCAETNPEANSEIIVDELVGSSEISLVDDASGVDLVSADGVFTTAITQDTVGKYQYQFFDTDTVTVSVFDDSSWYNYRVEQEPTADYNYRTLTEAAVALGATDESNHAIVSPFEIKFAGDSAGLTPIFVSSNGVISFTDNISYSWDNESLPYSDATSLVAAFWDDLDPSASDDADIYYETLGTTPNREFVIEWRDVPIYADTPNPELDVTFQIVFFENSEDILINYTDVDISGEDADKGGSATVGMQTESGHAMLYSFNSESLTSDTGIRFSKNTPPNADAGDDQTFTVGDVSTVELDGSATDADGNSTIEKHKWSQSLGPTVSIINDNSKGASFAVTKAGSYKFKFTVTDDAGEKDSSSINITISAIASSGGSSSGGSNSSRTTTPISPVTPELSELEEVEENIDKNPNPVSVQTPLPKKQDTGPETLSCQSSPLSNQPGTLAWFLVLLGFYRFKSFVPRTLQHLSQAYRSLPFV